MRRSVLTDGLAAWCEGRGGRPRRARVDECWAVLTAEGAYDSLVRDAPWKVHPGAHGQVLWTINGLAREVRWELRPNRLWRCGRAFLRCGGCDQRATRVYLPRPDTRSAVCMTCLGLSYNSRQENYRDNGPLKDIGLTRRACARQQTWLSRRRSRAAARARWLRVEHSGPERALLRPVAEVPRHPDRHLARQPRGSSLGDDAANDDTDAALRAPLEPAPMSPSGHFHCGLRRQRRRGTPTRPPHAGAGVRPNRGRARAIFPRTWLMRRQNGHGGRNA